jgi:hypothetical protein
MAMHCNFAVKLAGSQQLTRHSMHSQRPSCFHFVEGCTLKIFGGGEWAMAMLRDISRDNIKASRHVSQAKARHILPKWMVLVLKPYECHLAPAMGRQASDWLLWLSRAARDTQCTFPCRVAALLPFTVLSCRAVMIIIMPCCVLA